MRKLAYFKLEPTRVGVITPGDRQPDRPDQAGTLEKPADGAAPKVIGERLVDSSIAITMDIYAHILPGL